MRARAARHATDMHVLHAVQAVLVPAARKDCGRPAAAALTSSPASTSISSCQRDVSNARALLPAGLSARRVGEVGAEPGRRRRGSPPPLPPLRCKSLRRCRPGPAPLLTGSVGSASFTGRRCAIGESLLRQLPKLCSACSVM